LFVALGAARCHGQSAKWKAAISLGLREEASAGYVISMTEQRGGLPILAFCDGESFEKWLDRQSANAAGAWLKFPKKAAGVPGPTKAEVIDAALCYGWIDGQLDKYDDKYWLVRFTPRKARSKWSQVNKTRATQLLAEGRMREAGLAQIEAAKADGRWAAAYEPASSATVPADLQDALKANPSAAEFFATLNGQNRYAILYRIGSAKRPQTRARKIAEYVAMLERGETIHG
jgi:uncharacterized protein YdeI (YjbR/CyaY-like superfamily)